MEGTLHAGLNVTEYILSLADSAVINPPPDLSPLLTQLKRIGNNLNQLAHRANAVGLIDRAEWDRVKSFHRELREEVERWR